MALMVVVLIMVLELSNSDLASYRPAVMLKRREDKAGIGGGEVLEGGPGSLGPLPDDVCHFILATYTTTNWTAAYRLGAEEWIEDLLFAGLRDQTMTGAIPIVDDDFHLESLKEGWRSIGGRFGYSLEVPS
jgi:hypothetical protein